MTSRLASAGISYFHDILEVQIILMGLTGKNGGGIHHEANPHAPVVSVRKNIILDFLKLLNLQALETSANCLFKTDKNTSET